MSKWAAGIFNVTVDLWKGERTAGPSTPLRSGRDNPVWVGFGYRDHESHPDRSAAEWRDLLFVFLSTNGRSNRRFPGSIRKGEFR
jgi:hypothetical protein